MAADAPEKQEETEELANAEEGDAEMKAGADAAVEGDSKAKEPEKPKETEIDAAEDKRPKVSAGSVDLSATDSTLNVLPTNGNRTIMTYSEGGMQHLLAGVRANSGIKSGRYVFEVKMLERHNIGSTQDTNNKVPKHYFRVGLSVGGSHVLGGDAQNDSMFFDNDGMMQVGREKSKVLKGVLSRFSVVSVLVNLDAKSPNANTVSIFKDGGRFCEPQPIPESMLGKPLFPHIVYKNVSMQVNFGPVALKPLPFTCAMLGAAAKADVEQVKVAPVTQPEVVFPVGLPDQGYFDWVDDFLKKNPSYVDLSDRKIIDWAARSGLWKPRNNNSSNDKPDMKWGIPCMDDGSIRRMLLQVAPMHRRNIIVPEIKANLSENERKTNIARFAAAGYKKVGIVLVGEPTAEYKEMVNSLMLEAKKAKVEVERKRKASEEARKKMALENRRKREAAAKKKDGAELEDEEMKEDEEESKVDEEAVVELTDEEKALVHRKLPHPDISEHILAKGYANFSLPSAEDGFDQIKYAWQSETASATVVKDWIFAKKLTQRVEDIKVGEWFKTTYAEWNNDMRKWRNLQSEWKDPIKRKALLAKKEAAQKEAFEVQKKEAEEKGDEAPQEAEKVEIDFEDLEVMDVDDILDIGNGQPLFSNFAFEDWQLLTIRYEINLLLHSFKKDLNDSDRPSFTEKDLPFYFNKYFRKNFSLRNFAVETIAALQELVKDSFTVDEKTGFLMPALEDDCLVLNFVKLAEDHRRERQRRLDAGDETADLKFPRHSSPQPPKGGPPGKGSFAKGAGKSGGRPPLVAPPAPRSQYHGGRDAGKAGGKSGGFHGGNQVGGQKRAYVPASTTYPSKYPRTGTAHGAAASTYSRR